MSYDGKVLTLESMKDMSIDQIVDLYSNGYRIESLQACEDLGCVSQERLDEANKLILSLGGIMALVVVIGAFSMVVSHMACREKYEEKMNKIREIVRKDHPEIYAKIF